MEGSSSILGRAVKRVEDPRFIKGEGGYLPNRHVEGVVGVYLAGDVDAAPVPPPTRLAPPETARPAIAADTVRFAGEIVAVVVAESERQAVEAAGFVWADIEPLPAVADLFEAMGEGAPLVFEELDTNVIHRHEPDPQPDLFADADVIVTGRFRNQRVAAVPMETNNAMAYPTPGGLELWTGSQDVFGHRHNVARSLGMEREEVRTRVPDMGGGFGAKFRTYPEQILVAALARKLNRPVRWQETRRDNLAGMYQGRDQYQDVEIGATNDGHIVGLRLTVYQDTGAYPAFGTWLPTLTLRMACGVYDIPKVELGFVSVATHTTPTDAYRGAGRPEATAMVERAVDLLANKMGLDPAELRRRNFIAPGAFPVRTAAGALYDTGEYEKALDKALDIAGYEDLRLDQQRRRRNGDRLQIGIGLSTYVEITATRGDSEWSSVEVHDDGSATIKVGTSSHGHGHETAFAQMISDLLKIPHTSIRVLQGDTGIIARGSGTGGSRSLQIGGSSVLRSGEAVLDKARAIVADHYEASPDDIVLSDDGMLGVAGVPGTGLTWSQVATLTIREPDEPGDDDTRLYAEEIFEQTEASFPFGAHVAVVEVDTETGSTKALRHIAVDDCGTILNPILVDGQVHGGVAQGYGQALIEEVAHDDDANLLSGTLVSYLIPTAEMLPSFEVEHTQTPTPLNPLGAKGIGEAGTIGSTPAVQNAVIDAVAHLGVEHMDMPATAFNVWQAIQQAAG
jgi:carbon-monoxide dehydrogenase large subunit